jgi:hypothetical protein
MFLVLLVRSENQQVDSVVRPATYSSKTSNLMVPANPLYEKPPVLASENSEYCTHAKIIPRETTPTAGKLANRAPRGSRRSKEMMFLKKKKQEQKLRIKNWLRSLILPGN